MMHWPAHPPCPILLWGHPRCLSTAFERAFLQREDEFVCYHEPFGDPFYVGADALSSRFKGLSGATAPGFCHLDAAHIPTYMQVVHDQIMKHHAISADLGSGWKRVFVKDMAQHVVLPFGRDLIQEGNPTLLPKQVLSQMKHTCLLRNPHSSIPSFWRLCVGEDARVTGFHFFDPGEAGYSQLRTLFDYVHKLTHEAPLLITAEDLVADPRGVMEAYCDHVGVQFRPTMLKWEAKRVPAFDKWIGFHRDAQESVGIGKMLQPSENRMKFEDGGYPRIVYDTIEDNMPHYNYLLKFKTP